ncbi:hydroxyacid dehydrogenase [Microbacterium abyssi]|uniref:hydroxyacid dehydrogenase n=1 Tax=Microbacterium abyssi TaxID=2782166 RepID=UPI001E47382D|nr:hydroxyacid dehydrogenase [Microbacterium sp. A18JL241]
MSPASLVDQLFSPEMLDELRTLVSIDTTAVITTFDDGARRALREAEVVIAGWGAPRIRPSDAPNVRALVYLGGIASTCLDDIDGWAARGLTAANARAINAIPVAEYALAMILLDGKSAFDAARRFRADRTMPDREGGIAAGNYRRTVGIVGLSQTARILIERLRPFDFDVLVYSPELTPALAAETGVRRASLDEVFAAADIVSLHQPLIPATRRQIDRRLLSLLRDGTTLLNTARGGVVDQDALVDELRTGRIRAILDVTDPEPLPPGHELWSLPNVVLTPHIAGSLGEELHRMGQNAVEEIGRFVAGAPFRYQEMIV